MANYVRYLFIILLSGTGVSAQNANAISISAIPHKLFWENTPKSFSVNGDQIVIEAGNETNMFRDPNVNYNTDNAPKLLFEAEDNFVPTASIEHAFTNKCDGGVKKIKDPYLGE
jgi:hypothetical protein